MGEVEDALEGEALGSVVDAGGNGGDAGDGQDPGEDLSYGL